MKEISEKVNELDKTRASVTAKKEISEPNEVPL